jgi:uncharacterized Rossmann fold enzyme
MDFSEWEPIYMQILADFNFDRSLDEKAAVVLKTLIKKKNIITLEELSTSIKNQEVYIFGAGPNLETDVTVFKKNLKDGLFKEPTTIVADGATSVFIKNKLIPDIIVTDLDGNIPDQVRANKNGSIMIIHAHGDNISALKKWVPKFNGKLIGTTQAMPDEQQGIYNFGGFTDGDRAAFLASHFKAKRINLVAFNFKEIGKYSYKYHSKTKIRKLTWANLLIGMVEKPKIVFQPLNSK